MTDNNHNQWQATTTTSQQPAIPGSIVTDSVSAPNSETSENGTFSMEDSGATTERAGNFASTDQIQVESMNDSRTASSSTVMTILEETVTILEEITGEETRPNTTEEYWGSTVEIVEETTSCDQRFDSEDMVGIRYWRPFVTSAPLSWMPVHAEPLRMRTNVLYFRVMRRLYRREWHLLCVNQHPWQRTRGHGVWRRTSIAHTLKVSRINILDN